MAKFIEETETKEKQQTWLKSITIKPIEWFTICQESSGVAHVATNEVAGSDSSTAVLRTHPDILNNLKKKNENRII